MRGASAVSSEENPLSETARVVSSGLPCPRCHSPMEPGYLVVHAAGQYTLSRHVTWNDPSAEDDRPGVQVSDLWTSTLGGSPWLKGYRCPECEYLELGYGKSGLPRDGWRNRPATPE